MLSLVSSCLVSGPLHYYPSDNIWLDEESATRSIMYDLAVALSHLEDTGLKQIDTVEKRRMMLEQLEVIDILADELNSATVEPEVLEDHPSFLIKLPDFKVTVAQVRRSVLIEPPNYSAADQLARGCHECHPPR